MALMMANLRDYFLETHWDILIVNCMALIKASNWEYIMVKCLVLYFEMYMESHLGSMLAQIWFPWMDYLMVLMMTRLRYHCMETHWDILMVNAWI